LSSAWLWTAAVRSFFLKDSTFFLHSVKFLMWVRALRISKRISRKKWSSRFAKMIWSTLAVAHMIWCLPQWGTGRTKILDGSNSGPFLHQLPNLGSPTTPKFRHMFCRNKKFCSVKITFSCTFAVIQILDNIGSLPFISLAIEWNFQIIICSCPSTDLPSFVEKYPKIKYAISDRPHWRQLDVCETSFLLLNGSHWNLKFSLT
jgi:hypothetical protein